VEDGGGRDRDDSAGGGAVSRELRDRPLIGIDARKIRDFGIGSYIRHLIEALARHPESERYRFRVYLRRADQDVYSGFAPHFETAVEDSAGYSLSEVTRFAWRLWRDRLDLFHATHYVLPPLPRGRAVVTIHDIIHLLYPQFLPNRAAHLYARVMIRRALDRANRIITVSYNTKRDLLEHFGVAGDRVEVIYNGVSPSFRPDVSEAEKQRVEARYGLGTPYLLFLGGEKPHKNIQNVLRSFAQARRQHALPHELVLAGPLPKDMARLESLIAALDLTRSVKRPGIVDEEDLPGLYSGADAFLYPTLYEGFGLPVVEAMACGTPVLTSSNSALREIAGGFAYLVDPMDVDAIAHGIGVLTGDPKVRADLTELGKKRALDFSWDKAAAKTLEVYASALSGARRS
jgi:alpha-1,3-rhamnosyl/mannosyltransferase